MTKRMMVGIIIIYILISGTSICAQDKVDLLYDLFVSSILYPENFDESVSAVQDTFNTDFFNYFNRLRARLLSEGGAQAEICQQHSDPTWVQKCLDENQAAKMFLWCESLNYMLANNTSWSETYYGELLILIKRFIIAQGIDYVGLIRQTLPLVESVIRFYLTV
jgi:hypothetical protein